MSHRMRISVTVACLLILTVWTHSTQAQIVWSGRGSSRVWNINPWDMCPVPPSERYLQASGATIPASSAAFLIVGVCMSTADPDLLALPYELLITGHPSGQNPPPGLPPYTGGSPCWHHGVPTFADDPAMSTVVAAHPLNPIPGIGTWRTFLIPLSPQSLPASLVTNMEAYFTLDHLGDALEVMNDAKGFVSGIITASIPPDTILRYQAPAFGPQEFTKMHFPQHPDSFGMDINFTFPQVLADDWLCTKSDSIVDVRFWFSAQGDWFDPGADLTDQISNIHLSIHSNIPDPDGDGPLFSQPGEQLWEADFAADSLAVSIRYYAEGLQDWYDPNWGEYIPEDHSNIYECTITGIAEPFVQEVDSIYWLDVSIATDDSLAPTMLLGWKTSDRAYYPAGFADHHFMDDGVWGDLPFPFWENLTYPAGPHAGESLDLAFVLNPEIVSLAVCHDSLWYDAEQCGFDAYTVTGFPEMNHDCIVNVFDLFLLSQDWGLVGPSLSGDLNGDGSCNVVDFAIFLPRYGQTASPCTPDPLQADVFDGTIALSFSPIPATIVSTRAQTPLTTGQVHVVISGWANATILEYQIETSPNISIMTHHVTPYPHSAVSPVTSDPDMQHTYRAYSVNTTTWPPGPILWATIDYLLTDANPAYLKFSRVAFAPGNPRNRWSTSAADRGHNFKYIYNVGINGAAPTGVKGDTPKPFRIVSVSPNPFNPSTTVRFTLPAVMPVTAEVWSVAGERVRVLANQQRFGPGDNQLIWGGRNDNGSAVASGVYIIRLETPVGVKVARAVLLK